MKRPLGFVALWYGGGLLLAEFFQPPLPFLFAASLVLATGALLLARRRPFLLPALVVFTGWTNLVWRTAIVSPHDLRNRLAESPEQVAVRGRLEETPVCRVDVRSGRKKLRTLARLRVVALRQAGQWQPARGRIAVTTPGELPEVFFDGQEVEIAGVIAPPPSPVAEGLFDYRAYLRRQGIYFQLAAGSPEDWRLISSNTVPPFSDRFRAWARATLARGLPARDEPLRLLWAMTLGWKSGLTKDVYEPFSESGTRHIFAISGLHIALIAGILVSLLRVFQVSRAWCGLVVIPLLWFYAAATGWQPSAIRSTVMMSIVIGGWSLRRPGELLNSLAAAAFILLLWDPRQLFQASFQFSFFVVLGIALLLPPLEQWRDRLLRPDPLLPPDLVPRWQRWLGGPLRWLATGLAVSLAAWLGAWPLTAYYFHLFSPVTLFANLLILPLGSAALASSLGSLFCGAWLPWACVLFNHSAWFWMVLMMETSRAATQIPGAFFYVPAPAPADFGIYYGGLIAVLSGFALRPGRRVWAVAGVACVLAFYCWRWQAGRATVKLTILPLNGGSAVYVDAPGRANDLLVDCGNAGAFEFVMKPFLHAQGVNRLTCVALTHGDVRQVGGVEPLRRLLPVERIATSPARFRSTNYRRILGELAKTPQQWLVLRTGDQLAGCSVLHPGSGDHFPQADDNALVLLGEFQDTRVLLLSDLGVRGQDRLLERVRDLEADIIVAGLPEKGEPVSNSLLDAVHPRLVVIADSEYPATRRAGAALRERLKRRGLPVLYTRDAGAVTLRLRSGGFEAFGAKGLRLQGSPRPRQAREGPRAQ